MTFETGHDMAAGIGDSLFHDLAGMIAVDQASRQHSPQRGAAADRFDLFRAELPLAVQLPNAGDQVLGHDPRAAQCPGTVDDQRGRYDGTGSDRPHEPTARLHQFKQSTLLSKTPPARGDGGVARKDGARPTAAPSG